MAIKAHFFKLIIVFLLISLFSSCNFFLSLIGDITDGDTIAVQPANYQTTLGSAVQFKAVLKSRNSKDTDITTQAQWSSSNTAVATVSANGVVYAVGLGTAVITAIRATTQGTATVVVTEVPPTPPPTPAPTPQPTSNPVNWSVKADNINRQAPCLSGYLNNNFLYVGTGGIDGSGSLKIYSASDPLNLQLISTLYLSSPAKDVVAMGYDIFIANSTTGLVIVNASDPYSPQIVNTISSIGDASGVYVSGSYAYVATSTGLAVVQNIITPETASLIGTCGTGGYPAAAVAVSGNYAYLTTTNGVAVVDVSVVNPPVYKNTSGASGTNREIVINGNYVYYTDSTFPGTLRVLDISNPLAPNSEPATVSGCGYGIALNGTTGYATGSSIVYRLDIAAPGNNPFINGGSASARPGSLGIVLNGSYAYVLNEYFGITTINISTTPPTYVKSTAVPDIAANVTIAGNYAYIADGRGGLQIVNNINTPSSARLVNIVKLNDYVVDVAVSGNYAYAAVKVESGCGDVAELQILNISNPTSVSMVGTGLNISGKTAVSIDVLNNLVFLGTENSLEIINVASPAAPVQVGSSLSLGASVLDVKAAGNFVYLANAANGLKVYDVTTPASPSPVSVVSTGYAYKLIVDNDYCYVAVAAGLKIIAISDLSAVAGSLTSSGTIGVAISGNYAYLAKGTAGIEVADISNILAINSVKTISVDPAADAYAIAVTPWYGYVAYSSYGLVILGE